MVEGYSGAVDCLEEGVVDFASSRRALEALQNRGIGADGKKAFPRGVVVDLAGFAGRLVIIGHCWLLLFQGILPRFSAKVWVNVWLKGSEGEHSY